MDNYDRLRHRLLPEWLANHCAGPGLGVINMSVLSVFYGVSGIIIKNGHGHAD